MEAQLTPANTPDLRALVERLEGLVEAACALPWDGGCLMEERDGCQCAYIFDGGHAGGIGEVFYPRDARDGLRIYEYSPEKAKAAANLRLIVEAVNALPALLSALTTLQHRVAEMEAASIEEVWRQAEDNHRRYSDTGDREGDIRFLTLGLTGEAGEVANFVKKRWRDGDGHDEAIRLEIADVCAYAFMLANTMGMSPADLIATIAEKQQVFIAKMQSRSTLKDRGEGR